jgi:hypothetical protein
MNIRLLKELFSRSRETMRNNSPQRTKGKYKEVGRNRMRKVVAEDILQGQSGLGGGLHGLGPRATAACSEVIVNFCG